MLPARTAIALGLVTAFSCGLALVRPAEAVVVSELMAVNDSTIADEDGEFSDWLEIHNDGVGAVGLAGYYLTDDAGDLTKWQLPAVSIPAGEYLLVWASDKNRTNPLMELHTSFKLSGGGEYLALVEPDGTTIAHEYFPSFPAQEGDISYGLAADLLTERCFNNPTPGAANDESTGCGFIEPVVYSVERGFHDVGFSLELSTTTPGATIHYTTDASTPSETHGTVYSAPIPISTTTPVRAMAFGAGLLPLPSVTHTYIFVDDVLQQNEAGLPPEYPTHWTAGVGADYDMDPDVVNSPAYAASLTEDMRAVPTMSIVTDVVNLFDDEIGIYKHVKGKGVQWERTVSMEFFDRADGEEAQINCGLRIQGAQSRENSLRKHNLRLLFKAIHGPTKLEFPLFLDTDVDRFDTIVLTAGHGNSWQGGFERALYLRDTWAKDTQLDMGQVASHSTYVHLYLNGIYWGLYRPTERPTAAFMAEHFGGDKEEYDALRSSKVSDGDKIAWETMHSLANQGLESEVNYNALLQFLDVENLVDYMLVNFYGSNNDWDFHNWYAARKRQTGAGFKFFSWDAENILQNANGNRSGVNYADAPSGVYGNLWRENQEFRVLFGDHVQRHMFNGGALTFRNSLDRLLRRADEIDRAIVGESARWGDNRGKTIPFTRDVDWIKELTWQRLVFFPRRHDILLGQLRSRGLYPDVIAPSFSQHGGGFDPGATVEISAPAGILYYTDDGTDPRLPGGAVSPSAQTYAGPIALAGTMHVAARARSGLEWSAVTEVDFVEDTAVRVTEIMFHAPLGSEYDYIELTNVGPAPVDLNGFTFTDGIVFTFPPTVLLPGAQALVVSDALAFDLQYGAGLPVAGVYSGNLNNGGENLTLEDAAGNPFIDFTFEDLWYPLADGAGRSLVVRDPAQAVGLFSEAEGWRASGADDGSPGLPEPALCSNGIDDDGDGQTDLADVGCADGLQDAEDPACNDGVDNDGDGDADLFDSACTAPSDDSEESHRIDSFMCYQARENSSGPRFDDVDVTLADSIVAGAQYTVRKPRAICLPGELGDVAVDDSTTHLEAYQVREASGTPKPVAQLNVLVENVLGPLYLDTGTVDQLLVPSAQSTSGPVSPPAPASHQVDSYKCYRVKTSKKQPKYFPSGAEARMADEFENRQYKIKKPKHFCTPVDVDGAGIKNAEGHLLCYPARRNKFSGKHAPQLFVSTANVFGQDLLDTRREDELCVPTSVVRGLPQ